jgi:uncharacterized membrane protein YphA (DoxX/SURF4 family)
MDIRTLDLKIIAWCRQVYIPLSRIAFFIIFFYFGFLKLIGQSPASALAEALTARTIGADFYQVAFIILAIFECLIGILFLIPKATRIVIPLLFAHLLIVCSPLVLVPDHVWTAPFVPTLEGQYIIKNVALAAIAIGIAAHTMPIGAKRAK